ncbi:MAG: 30S ribosomal protein S1 [Deltaproteobacteria bacterium]|nr:MAG: 30S ribosomal protein S1 [Deltaproteobacteria bacterium]
MEVNHKELKELYEQTFQDVSEGRIVVGTVVEVRNDYVTVDVGLKSEGLIPLSEFAGADGSVDVKPGDKVEVFIERREDDAGEIVLSKVKADRIRAWERISEAQRDEEGIVEGIVREKVKGGFMVDLGGGVRGFLPASHVDIRPLKDPVPYLGKKLKFKVLKANRRQNNVVLSHRVYLEREKEKRRQETLKKLKEGVILEGTVKHITDYGAFVDIGEVDGLLHISDMSWRRVRHPSEILEVGQKVKVKVLKYDPEKGKISLGMKQLEPDPWEKVPEKYPEGTRVKGRVVGIADYGIFVEVEKGVEGLIHITDMAWGRKIKHPSKYVSIGDWVEAVVLKVEPEKRKMALGLKQLEPNPWDTIEERYPPGTRIIGQVRSVTDFGIFIGIEEGIDGLVHISNISWSRRPKKPAEMFKKGQEVEAVVLKIDRENERISLGIKQLKPDPWLSVEQRYRVGQVVTGTVTSVTDFGAFVEVEEGVEGLLHISEMGSGTERIEKPQDLYRVGDEVTAMIIHLDARQRRMGLSTRALSQRGEYREEVKPITLGDLLKAT